MVATVCWIVLLAASLVIELCARRSGHHVASLSETGAWVARRVVGRALLWALWIFIGLHLFARYGVQH